MNLKNLAQTNVVQRLNHHDVLCRNENIGAQLTIRNPFDREYFTISYWKNPVVNHNRTYGATNVAVWHDTDRDKRSFGLVTSSGNHPYYHKHEYPELIVSDAVNNNRQGTSLYYAEEQMLERTWQYVVLVYQQGKIIVYIDGNAVIAGKATTVSPVGLDLIVTLRAGDKLDHLLIYNRALSASDVKFAHETQTDIHHPLKAEISFNLKWQISP